MKEYKLDIDPRILELLGPNLYTNIYYVLAELIANAYDADSRNVYVIADDEQIRVEDDGHGMSYAAGDVGKFLNVAGESRTSEADSFSRSGERRKMGRKGVGKLAALSVSANVEVLTVANGEKSGFILSRRPKNGNKLEAISEEDVHFLRIGTHGSAIVMRSPEYGLHKTSSVVRKNLLKMFPLVDTNFRIHIIRGHDTMVIDSFDQGVMSELVALTTLGQEFKTLGSRVPDLFPQRRSALVVHHEPKIIPVKMANNKREEQTYPLEVRGWIGVYRSTRGRKVEITDFPDNFISLFANKKMGEFNILPVVGQNKLNEVYVVGQLHVDLFELTELPDMALSNRQGYKSDDPRYVKLLEYVRSELLPAILKQRELFTDLTKAKKKQQENDGLKAKEKELRESVDAFRKSASDQAADELEGLGQGISREAIEKALSRSINASSPVLGLKARIDSQKKKILISQTSADKDFADIIYQAMLFNNVPPEHIIYTNCDDEVSRIPEGQKVYQYLRDFFVESYSDQKIFVLFVTSENTKMSWGAITEVGASWITQVDHKIFNVLPFRPEHPLDDEVQWQSTNRTSAGELWMTPVAADIFCQKIEKVCEVLGHLPKSRADNKAYLGTLLPIRAK